MEQHKHMLQAYPAPVEKDVLEADPWLHGCFHLAKVFFGFRSFS